MFVVISPSAAGLVVVGRVAGVIARNGRECRRHAEGYRCLFVFLCSLEEKTVVLRGAPRKNGRGLLFAVLNSSGVSRVVWYIQGKILFVWGGGCLQ